MIRGVKRSTWRLLLVALGVAFFVAPLASKHPDGLDRVAEDQGFADRERASIQGILPGYSVPGVKHGGLSTALAGVAGTLLTLGVGLGIGKIAVGSSRKGAK